ncbi:MAG: chromosome segregation protein SMC [Cyclobacteriaceae bacterium]
MEHQELKNEAYQPTKNNRTPILIGVVVLLLGIVAFFYFKYEEEKGLKEAQTKELNATVLALDSISGQLNDKILTISQLGGEIDTLVALRDQLEAEKKSLLRQDKNQKQLIATLKGKVSGYTELLLAKDVEIEKLKKINEELVTENTELKTEKNVLNASIKEINKAKEELAEKVAFAARLKVSGMKVYAVNESGKERESEFRNRHIEQLKVTFNVTENKVAPIEGKELLVKITAPDGNTLFDVTNGSGSFTFEGREMFYTVKQEILYDKTTQQVTVFYKKGSDFPVGLHQVEVYTDDYKMGQGTFTVK